MGFASRLGSLTQVEGHMQESGISEIEIHFQKLCLCYKINWWGYLEVYFLLLESKGKWMFPADVLALLRWVWPLEWIGLFRRCADASPGQTLRNWAAAVPPALLLVARACTYGVSYRGPPL